MAEVVIASWHLERPCGRGKLMCRTCTNTFVADTCASTPCEKNPPGKICVKPRVNDACSRCASNIGYIVQMRDTSVDNLIGPWNDWTYFLLPGKLNDDPELNYGCDGYEILCLWISPVYEGIAEGPPTRIGEPVKSRMVVQITKDDTGKLKQLVILEHNNLSDPPFLMFPETVWMDANYGESCEPGLIGQVFAGDIDFKPGVECVDESSLLSVESPLLTTFELE